MACYTIVTKYSYIFFDQPVERSLPCSRGFSLAWLLAFTKSFASGLSVPASHANDFVNAKSHARKKSPLTG